MTTKAPDQEKADGLAAQLFARGETLGTVRRELLKKGYDSDTADAAIEAQDGQDLFLSQGVTADRLMATDLPEPKWAIPELLPEGLTVVAGKPKVGKSWLALGLAVAVAANGKALGTIDLSEGHGE